MVLRIPIELTCRLYLKAGYICNMNYFAQESERLMFRALTEEDIPSWVEFFHGNDRLEYMGIELGAEYEAIAGEWIRAQMNRYKNDGLGHLAVINKQSKKLIGLGGILVRDLEGRKEYEISYSLKPVYWGKGYGTEIAKVMRIYGQAQIETDRFISIIHRDNEASARVAIKNGMSILFETQFRGMEVNVYGG